MTVCNIGRPQRAKTLAASNHLQAQHRRATFYSSSTALKTTTRAASIATFNPMSSAGSAARPSVPHALFVPVSSRAPAVYRPSVAPRHITVAVSPHGQQSPAVASSSRPARPRPSAVSVTRPLRATGPGAPHARVTQAPQQLPVRYDRAQPAAFFTPATSLHHASVLTRHGPAQRPQTSFDHARSSPRPITVASPAQFSGDRHLRSDARSPSPAFGLHRL
jgi:hypothetical protein